MCHGAVQAAEAEQDGVAQYAHTLAVEEIALALDNETIARLVTSLLNAELRLAIAGVLLEAIKPGEGGYFSMQDVEDEAEAAARCDTVVRELRKRNNFKDAGMFVELAARHRRRALKIGNLLPESVQHELKQRMYGDPLGAETPKIEVVKS